MSQSLLMTRFSVGILLLITLTAGAYPPSHHDMAFKTIYTMKLYPEDTPIPVDGFRIYGGTSTEHPCSDLEVKTSDYSGDTPERTMYFTQKESRYSSASIDDAIGPELTCMRFDVDYHGQRAYYSSGNIRLYFDKKHYLYRKAIPAVTVAHFEPPY